MMSDNQNFNPYGALGCLMMLASLALVCFLTYSLYTMLLRAG